MAMFFYLRLGLVSILIGLFSSFGEYGILTTVYAFTANKVIEGPQLSFALQPPRQVFITNPNEPHYLPCHANKIRNANEKRHSFEYSWYRDGEKLQTSNGRRSDFEIFSNGTLRLPQRERASGIYQCVVHDLHSRGSGIFISGYEQHSKHNGIISESSYVEFPVLKRPASAQDNITAISGRFHTFNCPILSVPKANITWLFGNVSIVKKFQENRYFLLSNGSLFIKNITESDRGKYKCIAENIYAPKSHRHFMWILWITPDREPTNQTQSGTLFPRLMDKYHYIPIGGNLTLKCDGYTDVIEWWFRKNVTDNMVKIINNSRTFEIHRATLTDDGLYTCSTDTEYQTFTVVISEPPVIKTKPLSYNTTLASRVKLTCEATGHPKPDITWYHNGIRIRNTYTVEYNSSLLTLHSIDLKDEGIYQCFARNLVGEVSAIAQLKLLEDFVYLDLPNRPENVRCYPVNYNKINVTFDTTFSVFDFIMVNLHDPKWKPSWLSLPPISTASSSYLSHIVVSLDKVPAFGVFSILMRGLITTSSQISTQESDLIQSPQTSTLMTTLLSDAVKCATQGIPVLYTDFLNGIYLWWSYPKTERVKYFVLQFLNNDSMFSSVFGAEIIGTTTAVSINKDEIQKNLKNISTIKNTDSIRVIQTKQDTIYDENDDIRDNILNLVLSANVSGIFLPNTHKISVRVILITEDNEDFDQDLRYIQWTHIENATKAIRIGYVNARDVTFFIRENTSVTCIKVCSSIITSFNIIKKDNEHCEKMLLTTSKFSIGKLQPRRKYRFVFSDCKNREYFNIIDLETKADPPGTISNHSVIRNGGLKLTWDPPKNAHGNIQYYNIIWMSGNSTHESNISANEHSFQFPNVTENDKINATIRVVSDNGISAPIYVNLYTIENSILEKGKRSFVVAYWGAIVGGIVLSLTCILLSVFIFILHRKRFKRSTQSQSLHSDTNLFNQTPPSAFNMRMNEGDDSRNLSGTTHEYHEMQTLIPRSENIQVIDHRTSEQMATNPTLPNGNCQQQANGNNKDQIHEINDMSIALCSSTPKSTRRRDLSDILFDENQPINFEQINSKRNSSSFGIHENSSNNLLIKKKSSSPNFLNNSNSSSCGSSGNDKFLRNSNYDSVLQELQNGPIERSSGHLNGISGHSNNCLPPLKHSISTVSSSEPSILADSGNDLSLEFDQSATTSENSRLQLLGRTHLDRNDCKKSSNIKNNNNNNNSKTYQLKNSENASNQTQNDYDLTTATDLSSKALGDRSTIVPTTAATNHTHECSNRNPPITTTKNINPLTNSHRKINWTHRRPIIDPNG